VDTTDFLGLFITEAREHIETQAAILSRALAAGLGREEIHELFRRAHSIKGMAAAMGFSSMSTLAHAMEDLLHRWRDGALRPEPESLGRLVRANDHLSIQLDAVASGRDIPAGDDVVQAIRDLGQPRGPAPVAESGAPAPAVPPDPGDAGGGASRPRLVIDVAIRSGTPMAGARAMVIVKRLQEHGRIVETSPPPQILATGRFNGRLRIVLASNLDPSRLSALVAGLPDVAACEVTPIARPDDTTPVDLGHGERRSAPAPREAGADGPKGDVAGDADPAGDAEHRRVDAISSVRVATERMDHLLDGVGELLLDYERLRRAVDPEPGSEQEEILEGLGRTVGGLRDEVLTMRLLPFSTIVPRLERTVRDLAARLGKAVELEVRGTEVALDRSTLEEMLDPLQHILRNSIDHGLEDQETRRAAGKPTRGRIEIELSRREERIGLMVSDDGRGIDPQALRRVAVERRLLSREAATRLSDEEALMLVTIPGFSTATRTTDISGRGVGMDVVRMRVQKLGGHLVIRSQVGVGTRLLMDLPPTISVTRAFLCRASGGIFAVPVSTVHGTLEVIRDSVQASLGERVLRRGDDLVTVLPLAGVLRGDAAAPFPAAFPALLYQVGPRSYALGVDEILGEAPIVVKPLRHPLELLPQYAGAAILNDGQIALILDPVNLTRTARSA